MMMTTHSRGHKIYSLNGKDWFFDDNNKPFKDDRPCIRCEKMPTKKGHDACIANLPGVKAACCGHGKDEIYVIR